MRMTPRMTSLRYVQSRSNQDTLKGGRLNSGHLSNQDMFTRGVLISEVALDHIGYGYVSHNSSRS